jgi:hypothetical protein
VGDKTNKQIKTNKQEMQNMKSKTAHVAMD